MAEFGSEEWLVSGKTLDGGRIARLLFGVAAAAFTTGLADLLFTFWQEFVVKPAEALSSFFSELIGKPWDALTAGLSDAWAAGEAIFEPFGALAPIAATAVLLTAIFVSVWIVRRGT